jgi:hypothetical protein
MMIEAEMYGMIPSAKIEKRESAPPENMLNMSRMPPRVWLNRRASSFGSIPGRDERSDAVDHERATRKIRRRLRSPSLPMVAKGLAPIACLRVPYAAPGLRRELALALDDLDRRDAAAGLLDRGLRALGGEDAGDLEGLLDLAGEDDLGALGVGRTRPAFFRPSRSIASAPTLREVARAHLGRLGDRGREEAALGQAPLQRHLPALEADLVVAAGARFLALVAAARGLAQARADAAPTRLAACASPPRA